MSEQQFLLLLHFFKKSLNAIWWADGRVPRMLHEAVTVGFSLIRWWQTYHRQTSVWDGVIVPFGAFIPLESRSRSCCYVLKAGRGSTCSGVLWVDGKGMYPAICPFYAFNWVHSRLIYSSSNKSPVFVKVNRWSSSGKLQLSSRIP